MLRSSSINYECHLWKHKKYSHRMGIDAYFTCDDEHLDGSGEDPSETSALWHQRRWCLRVSLTSWGRRCGFLSVSGFQVKTLARCFGIDDDNALRHYPPGGFVVELRYHPVAAYQRPRVCFDPGLTLLRLWLGVNSLVSYPLHVPLSSPFSVLAICW